jgi:hypothetical protein
MSTLPCDGLPGEALFSELETQRIRAHLEELLTSQPFAGSRRRQAFLRYVVEETLAGRGGAIKEANIAVDVFGRSRDFDAHGGSLVRVTGGDVRKGLNKAYSSGMGQDVRIDLPLGGYQPEFHFAGQTADASEPVPEPMAKTRVMPWRTWWRTWVAAAGGAAVVLGVSVMLTSMLRPPAALDLMWQPFIGKDRPVLISMVAPMLLKLNPIHQSKYLPLDPAKMIPSSELVVLNDSFVGTGGALGAARFAEQLTSRKQKFDLKFGSDITFGDLKNSPTILIGVSVLSQRLTQNARFQLKMEEEGIKIVDSQQKDRAWGLPRRNYASPPRADGYSLITRILHSESGQPILMISGMDSLNTQAAVEFLTKNDLFRQFSDSAPADWASKNFQIVLHNNIYGNSAGSLAIVASEVR